MDTVVFSIALIFTALTFGGMTFFAMLIAPCVFIYLDEVNAGKLIRSIFPWYYIFVFISGGIGAVFAAMVSPYSAIGLAITSIGAVTARTILMPRINSARDKVTAGDLKAEKIFNRLHKVSVQLNFIGLISSLTAIVFLSLSL